MSCLPSRSPPDISFHKRGLVVFSTGFVGCILSDKYFATFIVTSITRYTVRFLTLSKKMQIHDNFIKTVRVLAKYIKVE